MFELQMFNSYVINWMVMVCPAVGIGMMLAGYLIYRETKHG